MPTSVVKLGRKTCRPFLLEVMVMSPESGYKFEVVVEKGCTAENDPIWKLVFDLYKKIEDKFEQIVHVSFKASAPQEAKGIQAMAVDGVSPAQARVLVEEVHPAAKTIEGVRQPTPAQKKKLREAMQKVTVVDL